MAQGNTETNRGAAEAGTDQLGDKRPVAGCRNVRGCERRGKFLSVSNGVVEGE